MIRAEWTHMKEHADLIKWKAAFFARSAQYLRLGLDRFAAADFVARAGGKLSGPALDIGTGKGLMAMALARQGLEVVSVDSDEDEQALAAFLVADAGVQDHIRFVCTDASVLPFPDNHFGCAALMDVLHHLNEQVSVLEETARVLKPSGVLILADLSPDGFELLARVHQEEGREHPVSGVTLGSAEAFLCRKGFQPTVRISGHKHEVSVLVKHAGGQP